MVARVEQSSRIPRPLALGLVVLGIACLGAAAVWYARGRPLPQS
jgi:hypothetical protein